MNEMLWFWGGDVFHAYAYTDPLRTVITTLSRRSSCICPIVIWVFMRRFSGTIGMQTVWKGFSWSLMIWTYIEKGKSLIVFSCRTFNFVPNRFQSLRGFRWLEYCASEKKITTRAQCTHTPLTHTRWHTPWCKTVVCRHMSSKRRHHWQRALVSKKCRFSHLSYNNHGRKNNSYGRCSNATNFFIYMSPFLPTTQFIHSFMMEARSLKHCITYHFTPPSYLISIENSFFLLPWRIALLFSLHSRGRGQGTNNLFHFLISWH